MQKYGTRKFALATALASFTLFLPPAFAASTQDDMRLVRSLPEVNVQSLSGAYLAAKSAQAAGALGVASDYYEKALTIDPSSLPLQREAMFTFLADGRFDRGVELAAKLRDAGILPGASNADDVLARLTQQEVTIVTPRIGQSVPTADKDPA